MTDIIYTEINNEISILNPREITGITEIRTPGTKGDRGEQGIKGDDGQPLFIETIASENIGGHRVVVLFDGYATIADNITNYIGQLAFTPIAVSQYEVFNAYISGTITEPSWSFEKGSVYLTTNGLLTQTIPESGSIIIVGNAITPTIINLQIQILCKR